MPEIAPDNPKSKRRWHQFRLKTIFVVVAVLSMPLAWLGVRMNQKRQERAVIAELQALGGDVSYDGWQVIGATLEARRPPGPPWLRKVIGDDFFTPVVALILPPNRDGFRAKRRKDGWVPFAPPVCGVGLRLEIRRNWPSDGPVIDDEGLNTVAKLCDLEELHLGWTEIGDAGLAKLSTLAKLRYLDLDHTNVTDAGLGQLQKFTGLERLDLKGTEITDEGVARLRRALPNSEIIR